MCARAHSTVCIMERGDLKSDPPVISDILTPLGTSVFLLESPKLEEEEADFSLPSWAWGIADTTSLPIDEQQLLRAEQGPGGRGYSPGICLLLLP